MQSSMFGVILFVVSLCSALFHFQSLSPAKPPILGNLGEGQYSNTVLGIQFELPASWQIENWAEAEKFSNQLPRRVSLHFQSNDGRISLSAFPMDRDEKLDGVFGISLRGTIDGGGFHTAGKRTKEIWEGTEMLSQKLTLKTPSGTETGIYRGFSSRGYYISILQFGPASTEPVREGIIKNLHSLSADTK